MESGYTGLGWGCGYLVRERRNNADCTAQNQTEKRARERISRASFVLFLLIPCCVCVLHAMPCHAMPCHAMPCHSSMNLLDRSAHNTHTPTHTPRHATLAYNHTRHETAHETSFSTCCAPTTAGGFDYGMGAALMDELMIYFDYHRRWP